MLNNILIQLLLVLYSFYQYLVKIFFNVFKRICLLYFINDGKIYNITLNYYLKIGLDKYSEGTFYIKEYNSNHINHVAYIGKLSEIKDFKIINHNSIPRRKNIILMNNDIPCNIDLNIFDNYKIHSDYYHVNCVKNLSIILDILSIRSSHVNIMTLIPFTNKQISTHDLTIDDLYD
ncbi:putative membrane protein [Moumouvirus maliensis]|nr:putative membrane protein [Moumouvirus maliensis]